MNNTIRVQTVVAELDRAAQEYVTAKANLERARIAFEMARTKFTGIRQLAAQMLAGRDWGEWQRNHLGIRFAGMPPGDAIVFVLRSHAYTQAMSHFSSSGKLKFSPSMPLANIVSTLEQGGFEFRSSAPLREVNAALVNLKNVTKLESGRYEAADAKDLFEMVRKSVEERKTGP